MKNAFHVCLLLWTHLVNAHCTIHNIDAQKWAVIWQSMAGITLFGKHVKWKCHIHVCKQWPSNELFHVLAVSLKTSQTVHNCWIEFAKQSIGFQFISQCNCTWLAMGNVHYALQLIQGSIISCGSGKNLFTFYWTYIISTLALLPCILPRTVPVFVFLTQPVMPKSVHFSRQHFVRLQPVECVGT